MPAPLLRTNISPATRRVVRQVARAAGWTEGHTLGVLIAEALRARGFPVAIPPRIRMGRPPKATRRRDRRK